MPNTASADRARVELPHRCVSDIESPFESVEKCRRDRTGRYKQLTDERKVSPPSRRRNRQVGRRICEQMSEKRISGATCIKPALAPASPVQRSSGVVRPDRSTDTKASMWPNSNDTQELLAEARAGDADAVDRLLARHRGAVRKMVQLRMDPVLARRVDASDIAQDVLVEAHRRLKEYLKNPQMPFHLLLRQMAKDRLIDAHRRHRVAARRSLDREQPFEVRLPRDQSTRNIAVQLCDGQLTPAAAATWRELKRRFEEACRALEPQDQEIVVMRHFEQLSNSEVATALKLSPQAASMRYLRAMRRLRELLADEASSQ